MIADIGLITWPAFIFTVYATSPQPMAWRGRWDLVESARNTPAGFPVSHGIGHRDRVFFTCDFSWLTFRCFQSGMSPSCA